MKNYLSITDIPDLDTAIQEALEMKKSPYAFAKAGTQKTIGLLFFNSSLRTRLSTEKAAKNLGMEVMTLNVNSCLLYTSPSPRDKRQSRMPSSA